MNSSRLLTSVVSLVCLSTAPLMAFDAPASSDLQAMATTSAAPSVTTNAAPTSAANIFPSFFGLQDLPYSGLQNFAGLGFLFDLIPTPYIPKTPPAGTISPVITSQPASKSATAGGIVTFSATITGTPTPTYQWLENGMSIRGANTASYTLNAAQIADAGSYQVMAWNAAGVVTSNAATLSVATSATASTITAPTSQNVATGATVNLNVKAPTGCTYQWEFNGRAISGATAATLTLNTVGPTASGTYLAQISNSTGVIANEVANVNVTTNARLLNLSVKGIVGTNNDALTVGFTIDGSGSKQILVRGDGPSLTGFGVSNAVSTPVLTLYGNNQKVIATNTAWGGTTALINSAAQVGAYPITNHASKDTALLQTLTNGGYSAVITAAGTATGVALAELYDADTGTPSTTMTNISGRAYVYTGGDVLTAGFTIAGPSSEEVLIRGIGPTLGGYGIRNVLKNTKVTLFDSKGNQVFSNAGWNNNDAINNAGTKVGAFPMMFPTGDSALLVTLAPGAYTVNVTGVAGTTGQGLVEIYEVK